MNQPAPLQAICIGHGLDVYAPSRGVVHSVFDHAVNLAIGGELWTLLAEDKDDLPFGIRVARSRFDRCSSRRGDTVNVRAGYIGIGSRAVVDCRMAFRWQPAAPRELMPGLKSRLAILAEAVRGRSWRESAPMAQALRSGLFDATALSEVIGRGPGLTPSGDDVLVGALAVLTSPHSGSAGARAAVAVSRALTPLLPSTTDVSKHLLRQATRGLFSRGLHELIGALIGDSSEQLLSDKIRRVVGVGATSGADTCEGILAFAPHYFGAGDERVST